MTSVIAHGTERTSRVKSLLHPAFSMQAATLVLLLLYPCTARAENESRLYPEAGIVFLTPAFINALAGIWYEPVGIRISGMYSDKERKGIQVNSVVRLGGRNKVRHCAGIAAGLSGDPGCEYYYAGPVYDLYYGNFFLEAGISKILHVIRGDFSDLPFWVILQAGYVHRFR